MKQIDEILKEIASFGDGARPGDHIAWLRQEDAEYWAYLNRLYKDTVVHSSNTKAQRQHNNRLPSVSRCEGAEPSPSQELTDLADFRNN